MNNYYVYVYIDPRNFEEFYFGKVKGSRKSAHLKDLESDSEKTKRIKSIKAAGLEPIIRVIARNLTQHDALLVEKTLLWKLGKHLTNISSGHYSDNFRPHDTFHHQISGFDFQNGIYYYNIGECETRNWDDYRTFNFISAGGSVKWRDSILNFQPDDIFAAYLKGKGFVGIGKILACAIPIRNFIVNERRLLEHDLVCHSMGQHADNDDLCEYICPVQWIKKYDRNEAKWKPKAGLYTTTHIRANLDNQPKTIQFLNEQFDIDLKKEVQ